MWQTESLLPVHFIEKWCTILLISDVQFHWCFNENWLLFTTNEFDLVGVEVMNSI